MRTLLLFGGVAVLGLVIGLAASLLTRPAPPEPGAAGAVVGDQRPDFRHGDLSGQWVSADDFDGRLLLVNFWATWCAPCRREMPVLQDADRDHGENLAVIGIAVDDPGRVGDFIEELAIEYPILVGSADVLATQRAWGNTAGVLPYTVLVDRTGIIRWQHLGEVSAKELTRVLEPWL